MIRGIQCTLDAPVLNFIKTILQWPLEFYVPWCQKVDTDNKYNPGDYTDFFHCQDNLVFLEKSAIWEIVIHGYPKGHTPETLEVYEEYLHSSCQMCLIYYDCGYLDIYIKDETRRKLAWDTLINLGAEDMDWLTDENDGRTGLATQ